MKRRDFSFGMLTALLSGAILPARAQSAQTIRIGVTPTGVPFTFIDIKTDRATGVAVDVMEAVAADAGFDLKITPMQFSSMIPALQTDRIDIVVTSLVMTEERKKIIAFSNPIFSSADGLVLHKDDAEKFQSLEQLKGQVVGTLLGSAFVDPLNRIGLFSEVKIYESIPSIVADVANKRIKAGVADAPYLAYGIKQKIFPNVALAKNYKPLVFTNTGFGFRQADAELLAKFNASLERIRKSGALAKIIDKWGVPGAEI